AVCKAASRLPQSFPVGHFFNDLLAFIPDGMGSVTNVTAQLGIGQICFRRFFKRGSRHSFNFLPLRLRSRPDERLPRRFAGVLTLRRYASGKSYQLPNKPLLRCL